MAGNRDSTAFRRALGLLLAALTLVLALFVARYHELAFPELSPGFSLKKSDVVPTAVKAAERLGFDTAGRKRAVTFDEDSSAKYFFELEYGLGRLADEVARGVSIWSWQARFFTPGEIEEFSVELDTEGGLVGLSHTIPETRELPRLGREAALARAEAFLAANVPRHPLAELKLIETEEEELTGHGVISFTWERRGWAWGDGTYHLHVGVAGDAVSRYFEHVDVPEAWSRAFRKRRSSNQLFQGGAGVLTALLALAALVQTARLLRQHQFHGRGFPRGWTLAAAAVALAAGASRAPMLLASYATNDGFAGHVAQGALMILVGATGVAVLFWVLGVLGDGFLRSVLPGRVTLRMLLGGGSLATRETLRSIALAFPVAAGSLAWVTAYYIVGRKVGIWSPSAIDNSKVFTSLFPAIEALNVGVVAGWTEELMFRGIFLATLWKLTRSRWAAIVVTAAAWGFLHSAYPQMPGYARGVELTAMGVLLGWVATRYGILTTVLAHCLFNTWIGAIVAWKSGDAAHMATAAVVSFWPVGLWATGRVRALRQGGYTQVVEPEAPPRPAAATAPALDTRLRTPTAAWVAAAVVLGGSLVAARQLLPERPLADLGAVTMSRGQALRAADAAFAASTGQTPEGFKRSVVRRVGINGLDTDYLLRHVDAETLAGLARRHLYADEWTVRYFRDGERETWQVHLSPRGELRYVSRTIAETAPGAELSREEAIGRAEGFLRRHFDVGADAYRFIDIGMTQQKARRDYAVTFESTAWSVGESKLRWTVWLLGDELRDLGVGLKLPEDYERERDARRWRDVVQDALETVFGLGALATVVGLLWFLAARGLVPWRTSLLLGLVPLALAAAKQVNLAPEFFGGYDTAQSLATFAARKSFGVFGGLVAAYVGGAGLLALLAGLLRWLTGRGAAGVLLGGSVAESRRRYLHGVVFAALGLAALGGLGLVRDLSAFALSGGALLRWDTPDMEGFSPGVGALVFALDKAVSSSLGVGAVALGLVALWMRRPKLFVACAVLLVLPDVDLRWRGAETVHAELFALAETLLEAWLFLRVFRFNPFAYALLYYYRALLPAAALLTTAAWPALRFDVVLAWVGAAAPLLLAAALLPGHRGGAAVRDRRGGGGGGAAAEAADATPVAAGRSSFDLVDAAALLARLGLRPGARVADLACGVGRYALALSLVVGERGLVFAVDSWRAGIDQLDRTLAERGITNVRPIVADIAARLPLDDAAVDLCLMATVLHDLPAQQQAAALGEAVRVLRPGGVLALVEFKKVDRGPGPPKRVRISEQEAAALVERHGLTAVQSAPVGEYTYLLTARKPGGGPELP